MKKFVSLLAAGSMALALSACGGNTTVETNTVEIETNMTENMAMPEPTPSPTVTPAPTTAGKEFDTTTTQDDAEAAGMTSRVDRGDDNSSAPAH